jgi:hypothetical protein
MSKTAQKPKTQLASVQSSSTAVAPPLDMPKALQQYLAQLDVAELLTTADETRAWEVVSRGMEMSAAGTIIAGHQLRRLRSTLAAGRFAAELAERRIARQSAYDAIKTYELFASMEEIGAVRALGQLGLTKARALENWSEEEVNALASGEEVRGLTFDTAAEMSTRDLETHLKIWKRENDEVLAAATSETARLRAKAEQTEIKLHTAEQALKFRDQHAVQPPWFKALKVEAAMVSETLDHALEQLEPLTQSNLFAPGLPKDQAAFREQAAGCLFHALTATVMRSRALLARIATGFPGIVDPKDRTWQFALEGDELALAAERRAEVLRLAEFQRAQRQREKQQAGVDAAPKRGRGRPAGSKNKPKAKG